MIIFQVITQPQRSSEQREYTPNFIPETDLNRELTRRGNQLLQFIRQHPNEARAAGLNLRNLDSRLGQARETTLRIQRDSGELSIEIASHDLVTGFFWNLPPPQRTTRGEPIVPSRLTPQMEASRNLLISYSIWETQGRLRTDPSYYRELTPQMRQFLSEPTHPERLFEVGHSNSNAFQDLGIGYPGRLESHIMREIRENIGKISRDLLESVPQRR